LRLANLLREARRPFLAKGFRCQLLPLKKRITSHPIFRQAAEGTLSVSRIHSLLQHFYPLIESFPLLMAANLAKANRSTSLGHGKATSWLIDNINVEQHHATWWRDWGYGFGCRPKDFDEHIPPPAVDALTHYLWSVNFRGSLAEGIAATNLAIEWPTGEWAATVFTAMRKYKFRNPSKTLAWLSAHATYDEDHPFEAMQLIVLCTSTINDQRQAISAATRAMEYYLLALDTAMI
jgi:pyrroloquinoline quinone (PQQ) biosynthesis protein C